MFSSVAAILQFAYFGSDLAVAVGQDWRQWVECHTLELLAGGKITTISSALEHAVINKFSTLERISNPSSNCVSS